MKKRLLSLFVFILFTSVFSANDAEFNIADKKHKAIYDSAVKKDWNGFDGKGAKSPAATLVFEGDVDFPYSHKHLKKHIKIYKYDKPVPISFIIPIDQLDYKSTPEMALLSCVSDYRDKDNDYWEELKFSLVSPEKRDFFCLFYKIIFTVNDNDAVALMDSTNHPPILCKEKKTGVWEWIRSFANSINLDLAVVDDNLDLISLKDSLERKLEYSPEKIEVKIRQLIENKLIAVEDEDEMYEKEAQPGEAKEYDEAEWIKNKSELPPEELKKIDEEIKKGNPPGMSTFELIINVGPPGSNKPEIPCRDVKPKEKSE